VRGFIVDETDAEYRKAVGIHVTVDGRRRP
jgi:hypothetical protein